MLSGYKKRFFILINDKLAYFDSETDIDPKGAIDLKEVLNIVKIDALDFIIEVKLKSY